MLVPLLLTALKGNLKSVVSGTLSDLGQRGVDEKMTAAIPVIVAEMESDGATPADLELRQVVRGAMFRLWKVVVNNGHAADAFRDAQDDKVVAAVLVAINRETPLAEIVTKTKDEIISLTF